MTRYELHCKRCDQVLGYMTYPGSTKDYEILNSTQVFGKYHEILCPICEVRRLRDDKDPLEEDAKQASIPYSYQMPKDYIKNRLDYSRPKGEWIDTGSGQECNVCHEIQYGYDNFRHFCANCGAYMQTKENSNG